MMVYEIDEDGNDREEIAVHEAKRLLGPKSLDDDWKPTGIYTSELRDDNDPFYAFVDFHSEEGKIKYCPHCLQYGFENQLRPRILKKDEVKQPDYDLWAQCYECGEISPLYEAVQEAQIKHPLETIQNPFENESVFMSVKKRNTKTEG